MKGAEQEFATSALSHARAALRPAYALDLLANARSHAGRASLDSDARVKWAQMVDRHSTAAMTELQALRLQLDSVAAGVDGIPSADFHGIADSSTFVRAASDLRARTQSVNEEVVELFAGSAANPSAPNDAGKMRKH